MAVLVEDRMRHESHPTSKHEQHIVERLAKETATSEQEARRTYEHERERLDRGAKVKTYVSIIAARRAKDTLRGKAR